VNNALPVNECWIYPLSILLFVEKWLKKGFEDEESRCSSTVYEFACAVSGSDTMEAKAQEIASLIENPDYVRRK
jgi:hypothetical protein